MADTPQMPAPVAHLHSNGDFCQDRFVPVESEWPVKLYTAAQMHAFRAEGVREALERAAQACEAMHDEDRPGDYAYAIRALVAEIQPPQKADT